MPTSQSNKIVITMGDAAGIGPEVIVKALGNERLRPRVSYLVIGERWIMEEEFARQNVVVDRSVVRVQGQAGLACPRKRVGTKRGSRIYEARQGRKNFEILDMGCIASGDFKSGVPNERTGRAAREYIKKAVEIVEKEAAALVTAPVSKAAVNKAGFKFSGHTEFLAELTGADAVRMMLIGGPLKVVLVTTHLPLRKVPSFITRESVFKTIEITDWALRKYFKIFIPKIAVCGLNPHLGEGGVLGDEEETIIRPAINDFQKRNSLEVQLLPADTIFHKAYKGVFDAVIGMYHDQALGPLKMMAFDTGVNFTLGLPFIRTSPGHGVAADLAGKGNANPASMVAAIDLALKIC